MIQIKRAAYEDIPKIMEFIDQHWKKGHIMGNDRTMFEFQHVRNGEVFYLIAEDDEDGKIYGSMGYIPMASGEYPEISTTMILSIANPEKRMLGEEMSRYLEQQIACSNVISVGIRERYARTIMKLGGNHIGCLDQYYILNPSMDYKIARIDHCERAAAQKSGTTLVPLPIEALQNCAASEWWLKNKPYRDPAYMEHRYYRHPYYQYCVWGLERDQEIRGILVARVIRIQGRKILRLIDYVGEDQELAYVGDELLRLLQERQYEYLDFYCYGIDPQYLEEAGFILRTKEDTNIIPNYFEPFEQRNVELYFYTWFMDGIHVYRGLGDQDRPNLYINKNNKEK